MKLPLTYLDATAVEEIRPELWADLFDAVGWFGGLNRENLSHEGVLQALQEAEEPSDELLRALECVHELGTEEGCEALIEAMTDRSVSVDFPKDCGERELAVLCFIRQLNNRPMADAFIRAQIKTQATTKPGALHELRGKDASPVKNLARVRSALEDRMRTHCKVSDLGEHVEVEAFEGEGACVFRVMHGDRMKKQLTVQEGSKGRSVIGFRPVHCDLIRYEAVTGRLQVSIRRATMLRVYETVLGEVFFDDPEFFSGEPACTLRPLQEQGRALLDSTEFSGVGVVRMTEVIWQHGDARVIHLKSTNCFDDIERLALPIQEGTFIQAKLKIQVIGQSTRPVTVTIRVPSKIQLGKTRHENLVRDYLEALGIRIQATPKSKLDLWSLHPWREPPGTWRAVFGDEVESLRRAGALKSTELRSVAAPGSGGRRVEVHHVGDDGLHGVGVDEETPSRSLSETDVEGLELEPESFRDFVQNRLDLEDGEDGTVDGDAADVGVLELAGRRFRVFYLMRQPGSGFGAELRKRCGTDDLVLLVPKGRSTSSELVEVQLEGPLPTRQFLHRAVALEVGMEEDLPAQAYAPERARLVVDTRSETVWIDEVEVAGLKGGTQPYNFVLELARVAPKPVDSMELSRTLSGARSDGSQVARHAATAARKALRDALAAQGIELDVSDPFPNRNGSFRSVLQAFVG